MEDKLKILFVVNVDWFFISHRLPIALEGIKRGYNIYLATSDTGQRNKIEHYGIHFINIDFERSTKNPFNETGIIFKLVKIYRKYNFHIIHHVTIKPAIYGSIAARLSKNKPNVINAISGLGYNFTGNRKSIFQNIILKLMRYGFEYSKSNFIFQNPDDLSFYSKLGFLNANNFALIKGAGVDQDEFPFTEPLKKDVLQVLLSARMLFDKGIKEFCEAAKILEKQWKGKAQFILCGDIDLHNPAGATQEEIKKLLENDYIIWLGHQKNIKNILTQSDIVCLPSYREGLPKALIEAMAIGRPIISTDVPGCRECVEEGINGFLVPSQDSNALAIAIDSLLKNKDLRIQMGAASRIKMENELSIKKVISQTFSFYEEVLTGNNKL